MERILQVLLKSPVDRRRPGDGSDIQRVGVGEYPRSTRRGERSLGGGISENGQTLVGPARFGRVRGVSVRDPGHGDPNRLDRFQHRPPAAHDPLAVARVHDEVDLPRDLREGRFRRIGRRDAGVLRLDDPAR